MTCFRSALFITLFLLFMNIGCVQNNECSETRCRPYGPPIRFPFTLVGEINDHCGYPGFHLSCDPTTDATILELPTVPGPLKFRVSHISYKYQEIHASYIDNGYCLPAYFVNLRLSLFSPFQLEPFESETTNITVFNCSTTVGLFDCPIYTTRSDESIMDSDLLFCTKMFQVSPGPLTPLLDPSYSFNLKWSNPTCRKCEAKGMRCRFKNNTSRGEIQCFDNRNNLVEEKSKSTILASIGKSENQTMPTSDFLILRASYIQRINLIS